MDIGVLGVDLGKNVCSVVGLNASGAVVMRRRVRRETLIALAEKLPDQTVEAMDPVTQRLGGPSRRSSPPSPGPCRPGPQPATEAAGSG